MSSIVMQKMLMAKKNLIILTNTKKIQQSDLIHFSWQTIHEAYKSIDDNSYDPAMRAVVSCLNAAVHHNKIAFAITRNSLQNLIREDENYTSKQGQAFNNNKYSSIIKYLFETGIFEKLPNYKQNSRSPMGIILKLEPVVEYMKVDHEKQVKDLIEFLDNNKNNLDSDEKADEIVKAELPSVQKCEQENKISFDKLLKASFPSSDSISFEKLKAIIDLASLNCFDFDESKFTVNILVNHYFGKKQKTKKARDYREKIEEKFEHMLGEHFAKNIKIIEPEPVSDDAWEDEHTQIMKKEILKRHFAKMKKKNDEELSE